RRTWYCGPLTAGPTPYSLVVVLQYVDAPILSPKSSHVLCNGSSSHVIVTTTGDASVCPNWCVTTCAVSTGNAGYVVLGAPLSPPSPARFTTSGPASTGALASTAPSSSPPPASGGPASSVVVPTGVPGLSFELD